METISPNYSSRYLFKYQFESHTDPSKEAEIHSFLTWASKHGSVNIVGHLANLEGADLTATYSEKTSFHYLLNIDLMNERVEKLIEEMWQIEPKSTKIVDCNNVSMFQLVVQSKSTYLCRVLVEKTDTDIDVNKRFHDGSTPLTKAIRLKSKPMFDQLVALGASFNVKARNESSVLHETCEIDWPDVIPTIFSSFPDMLEWKNEVGNTPLQVILLKDSSKALEAIAQCIRKDSSRISFKVIEEMREKAVENNSEALVAWFNSLEIS